MIKGFGVVEFLVALTITGIVIAFAISHTVSASRSAEKIIDNQQRLEGIFHTMESIKSDLTKCGMRLMEAASTVGFPLFMHTTESFKVIYGVSEEIIPGECLQGDTEIFISRREFFKNNRTILLFDPFTREYEFNTIKSVKSDRLILKEALLNNYTPHASLVVLNQVEYKIYEDQKTLKRKVNNGYFQPVLEEVTDFNVQYFPDAVSVLYTIEINQKEQLRGYIFMTHMAAK